MSRRGSGPRAPPRSRLMETHRVESFQKRDRDRKKLQKRNEKELRRKERAERRRSGGPGGNDVIEPPSAEQRRHTRKYAVGQLPPGRSFYFRGPKGKLNLRAQNLLQFLEVATGVDDDTWEYHLRQGDYSRWFRDVIKDTDLAATAAAVEHDRFLSRDNALAALRAAIESRYTLPADAPLPVRGAS